MMTYIIIDEMNRVIGNRLFDNAFRAKNFALRLSSDEGCRESHGAFKNSHTFTVVPVDLSLGVKYNYFTNKDK